MATKENCKIKDQPLLFNKNLYNCIAFYPLQYRDEYPLVEDITKLFEKDLID